MGKSKVRNLSEILVNNKELIQNAAKALGFDHPSLVLGKLGSLNLGVQQLKKSAKLFYRLDLLRAYLSHELRCKVNIQRVYTEMKMVSLSASYEEIATFVNNEELLSFELYKPKTHYDSFSYKEAKKIVELFREKTVEEKPLAEKYRENINSENFLLDSAKDSIWNQSSSKSTQQKNDEFSRLVATFDDQFAALCHTINTLPNELREECIEKVKKISEQNLFSH